MSKSTEANNRMTHRQIKKACDNVGRSEQKEVGCYRDEKTGVIVKILAGPESKPYRGIPCGWVME